MMKTEAPPTPEQTNALRNAKGGCTTYEDTRLHQVFEEMAERGWVKEVTLVSRGVAWKLSGGGLDLAYADER